MDTWLTEETMMGITSENNFSETSFLVKEEQGYHLRWLTPGGEIDLCGHATLASAYILFRFFETDAGKITFRTLSGELSVEKKDDLYEMDFPLYELRSVPVTDSMEKAIGVHGKRSVMRAAWRIGRKKCGTGYGSG